MLQIALWKRVLIWLVVAAGFLTALPNAFYARVEGHNDAIASVTKSGVETPETEAARAAWPDWMPSGLVNLGLDLRGGAHLLAEVHLSEVYEDRMNGLWPEVRDRLRDARAEVGTVRRAPSAPDELKVQISQPEGLARAVEIVRGMATPVVSMTGMGQNDLEVAGTGDTVTVKLSDAERTATDDRTMQQSLEIVRRRIDEVGTREPTIQREGDDRILIQVPGIGSAEELKNLIGTTAQLNFQPVIRRTNNANEAPGAGNMLAPAANEKGVYYVLEQVPVVTGEELTNAQPSFDQNGRPAVSFTFNPSGARKFGDYTAANIGQLFAIVLDDEVISAPQIQSHIAGGSGIITGNFTVESSTELAVLLRAGALPAQLTFLEERTIGPELGQDSIDAGRVAAIVGFCAVTFMMVASYGLFGVFATFALIVNMALILGAMSMMGATLTLPGIAGLVLTMGMAVDANVLIFERIREELKRGRGPSRSIDLGFERAMSAVMDGNITTFITGLILFFLGSGPVKGFAVTLVIGLATSVFSAIFVTRLLIVMFMERRRPKSIIV
ncbi:protein translocase subunit SecD [Frigidibacter sp. MR17.14]|uniref:protein translocase subunit SecD n=1 Tax=Frigidibacter sp. MR17.14 TaxID=3126509 RepID=UPI0030129D5A